MTKKEFLLGLEAGLRGLPQSDINERVDFYSEIIDDCMEEGRPEQEAVAEIGDVEKICEQIISETPISKIVKHRVKPRRKISALEIVLLALGSPIWISLFAAAVSVVISLYAAIWSVLIALFASGAAIAGAAVGSVALLVVYFSLGNVWAGISAIGVTLLLCGVCIIWFVGCGLATKCTLVLTKKLALAIKSAVMGKGHKK